jgi:hypothetical protein
MKRNTRKLNLHRETLANLNPAQLSVAQGGALPTEACHTRTIADTGLTCATDSCPSGYGPSVCG